MFGEQQHDALEDYIETSLMLQVNDRRDYLHVSKK